MRAVVTEKEAIAADTVRVRFADQQGKELPSFEPGAHIELTFVGMVRRYSLTSPPDKRSCYEICVLRTEPSAGGSVFIHDHLAIGDEVELSEPRNAFRWSWMPRTASSSPAASASRRF